MKTTICSIFSALILLYSTLTFAVDETEMEIIYDLIDSQAYSYGGLVANDGIQLNYLKYGDEGKNGVVVILPGRTEPSLKYIEMAYDLVKLNYGPIYVLSHRGQGLSQRVLRNPRKGYVRRFSSYSSDVNLFMNEVVIKQSPSKRMYLIAHSMGGAIAARYLQNFKSHFHKVVLMSPMLQIDLGDQSERSVLLQTTYVCKLPFRPRCTDYIPGGTDGDSRDVFEDNVVTSSRVRFDLKESLLIRWPELKLGSPTFRWLRESLIATRKLRHKKAIKRIQTPMLILQAEKDVVVKNFGQNQFCSRTPFCELKTIKEAKHEILFERDSLRNQAITEIKNFLSH